MNVLAIDTCFGCCTAAVGTGLGGDGARVVSLAEPMATGHAERIIPMIDEILRSGGVRVPEIDRIAVADGPGTFTGTRIAVSAARSLALAAGCPIVSFSSLDVIAQSPVIEIPEGHDLAVVMAANRGEVYIQQFCGRSREPKSAPELLGFAAAAARLPLSIPVIAVGSGANSVVEAGRVQGRDIKAMHPDILSSAGDILLRAMYAQPLAHPLRPLYLRPPDAKPQDGKSLARAT